MPPQPPSVNGTVFPHEGFWFRVRKGRKGPQDEVLDCWNGIAWVPIKMSLQYMMGRFIYQNEDKLYPPPTFQGGEMFLDQFSKAAREDWRTGVAELNAQKQAKRDRLG